MQYYAHINNEYYRFFAIKEGKAKGSCANDFLKLSICIDPEGHKKISTEEYTVHPLKIAKKTNFRDGTKLYGDYKGKEIAREYVTLYALGYKSIKEGLIKLFDMNVNGGFAGRKKYSLQNLKNPHRIVNFPNDPYRPYWMSAFFTTYGHIIIKETFNTEDLDEIIFEKGENGNFVFLLKHIIPEWETLGIEPEEKLQGWVHPTFSLSKKYYKVKIMFNPIS